VQRVHGARGAAAQFGLHLGPDRLDRAEIGRMWRQVAIAEARSVESAVMRAALWAGRLSMTSTSSGLLRRSSGSNTRSR
jgi:hypothetical protein